MDQIIVELNGRQVWGIAVLLIFLIVPIGISLLPNHGDPETPPVLTKLKQQMGLGALNGGVFFIGVVTWCVIFGSLFLGLAVVIWQVIFAAHPDPTVSKEVWDWRFALVKFTALTATLGAVVALPFTMVRLGFSRRQTETAVEALLNDKIDAAVADLHAQRQVTEWSDGVANNGWQDDVTRRNGAIDRLQGLAEEDPKSAPRIARMLSVYVRELSREYTADPAPDDIHAHHEWARSLRPKRSDMENAAQALGRLKVVSGQAVENALVDLSATNLQGFTLGGLAFQKANFRDAKLQGSQLTKAKLRSANFSNANLDFTNFAGAMLDDAVFDDAQMRSTILMNTSLTNASMLNAKLEKCGLHNADLSNSNLMSVRLNDVILQGADISGCSLEHARIDETTFISLDLTSVNMKRAILSKVNFLHTILQSIDLQETRFLSVRFKSSKLVNCVFDGTYFEKTLFDSIEFGVSSFLFFSNFVSCAIRESDLSQCISEHDNLLGLFGDASVILPGGHGPDHPDWPEHWSKETLDWEDFIKEWRAFQASIGQDPNAPD